jgi:hypothetical protein
MQRAVERVRSIGWNDVIGQYAAVSETLFWIDIVEDQLRMKYARHYNAALDNQRFDARSMLKGLRWARNRITHEVDEIHYLLATATSADGFAAEWKWQSLRGRPKGRDPEGHAAYQASLAGSNVVNTLLAVTTCLGQAASLSWMEYGKDHGRRDAHA